MSKELIILAGFSCSGKTTYAEYLETKGYSIIHWDLNFQDVWSMDMRSPDTHLFVASKLSNLINSNPKDKFVLDGFLNTPHLLNIINKQLDFVPEIQIVLAPRWAIIYRILQYSIHKLNQAKVLAQNYIDKTYLEWFPLLYVYDNIDFINTLDCDYTKIRFNCFNAFKEYWQNINKEYTLEECIELVSSITKLSQEQLKQYGQEVRKRWAEKIEQLDVRYQGIDLKLCKYIGDAESHKTWENIKKLTDYIDKDVLDIGCHHGYFCFKIIESRAKKVWGLDLNPKMIENAKHIRNYKQAPVSFMLADITKEICLPQRDITLVLNNYHHLKHSEQFINNIFNNTNEIIFEMNQSDLPILIQHASNRSFQLTKQEIVSHRIDYFTNTNRIIRRFLKI